MDFGKFGFTGEWLELEGEAKGVGKIKFRILPKTTDITPTSQSVTEILCNLVTDWEGIEENGAKVPCTPENKARLIPFIGDLKIKGWTPDSKGTPFFGTEIMAFARDVSNYLKN